MRNSKAIASPGKRFLRSRTQKCRVCLKNRKEMVNIFNITPEHGVSIADMLSQSTGLQIFKGDSNPETVCTPCLQDAKRAFEIKQQLKQDPEIMLDLKEEEIGIQVKSEGIEDVSEESAPQMEYFQIDEFLSDEVMHETTEEYILNEEPTKEYISNEEPTEEYISKEEQTKEYVHGQVINEPIEDDLFEEAESLDYDIEPSYLQEQSDPSYIQEQSDPSCLREQSDPYLQEQSDPSCLRKQYKGTNDKNYNGNSSPFLTLNVSPNSFFQCSSCPMLFSTISQMKRHEYHHEKPTYKCSYCQKAFLYHSLLQQHIRTHTGERPYKCLQCQKGFSTPQQYSLHFKSHAKNPLFKCSHCDLVFKSLAELEEHIKTHTKEVFKCSVKTCPKVFHNEDALKNHITFNHPKPSPIMCFHCQTDFSSSEELIGHLKVSHPEDPQKKFFFCSYCEKSFKRQTSLKIHVTMKHPMSKEVN